MSDAPVAAPAAPKADQRGSRRVIVGTVTSSNMDKTATVTVIRRVRDGVRLAANVSGVCPANAACERAAS